MTVDPVPGASSTGLRRLLLAILSQQYEVGRAAGKAAAALPVEGKDDGGATTTRAGAAVQAAVKMLELIIEARHALRPMIQAGNSGCGDRCDGYVAIDQMISIESLKCQREGPLLSQYMIIVSPA